MYEDSVHAGNTGISNAQDVSEPVVSVSETMTSTMIVTDTLKASEFEVPMLPKDIDIYRVQIREYHKNIDGPIQAAHAHFTPSTSVSDLEWLQHKVKSDPTKVCTSPKIELEGGVAAVGSEQGGSHAHFTPSTSVSDLEWPQHKVKSDPTKVCTSPKIELEGGVAAVGSEQGGSFANLQTNSINECRTHITGSSLILSYGGAVVATTPSSASGGTKILGQSDEHKTDTTDSPFYCGICGKNFTRIDLFKNHAILHIGEEPHKCNLCIKTFKSKKHFMRHMMLHNGGPTKVCTSPILQLGEGAKAATQNMDVYRAPIREHHINIDGPLQPAHTYFTPSISSVSDLEQLQYGVKSDPTKVGTSPRIELGGGAAAIGSGQEGSFSNIQTNSINQRRTHITGSSLTLPMERAVVATAPSSALGCTQISGSSDQHKIHNCGVCGKDCLKIGHKCKICFKTFKRKEHLRRHLLLHSGETPFHCKYCSRSFTRKDHMVTHERLHTMEKPYQCHYCSKKFARKDNLTKHERTHTKKQNPKLCHCPRTILTKNDQLGNPTTQITDESLKKCNYCLEKLKKKHLTNPILQQSVQSPSQCQSSIISFSCELCNRTYTSKEHLRRHIQNHTPITEYNCHLCDKTIPTKEKLLEHNKEYHSKDFPYVCVVCKKSFKFKGHLLFHLRLHPKGFFDRAYKCDLCPKDFKTKWNLTLHRRSHANPLSSNFIPSNSS